MTTEITTVLDPSTLTITQYQTLAAEFSAQLDRVLSMLPKSDHARPITQKFLRSRLNVPFPFLGTAIAGAEEAPRLKDVVNLDVNVGRDTLQFIEAFRPIIDKMALCHKQLSLAVKTRQALLTDDALQIYHVVKGLARDENNTPMVALCDNLKRDLGRAEALRKNNAKKAAIKEKLATEKAAAIGPTINAT